MELIDGELRAHEPLSSSLELSLGSFACVRTGWTGSMQGFTPSRIIIQQNTQVKPSFLVLLSMKQIIYKLTEIFLSPVTKEVKGLPAIYSCCSVSLSLW